MKLLVLLLLLATSIPLRAEENKFSWRTDFYGARSPKECSGELDNPTNIPLITPDYRSGRIYVRVKINKVDNAQFKVENSTILLDGSGEMKALDTRVIFDSYTQTTYELEFLVHNPQIPMVSGRVLRGVLYVKIAGAMTSEVTQEFYLAPPQMKFKVYDNNKTCFDSSGPARISQIYLNHSDVLFKRIDYAVNRVLEIEKVTTLNAGLLGINLGTPNVGVGYQYTNFSGIGLSIYNSKSRQTTVREYDMVALNYPLPPKRAGFVYSNDLIQSIPYKVAAFNQCGRLIFESATMMDRAIMPAYAFMTLSFEQAQDENIVKKRLDEVPQIHTCPGGSL